MKKSKISIITLTTVSFMLLVAVLLGILLPAVFTKAKPEKYTVCDDGEYYSETTYYKSEKAYKEYLKELAGNPNITTKSLTKSPATKEAEDDGTFVAAAVKQVWAEEEKDENGNIVSSRLLNKTEIQGMAKGPVAPPIAPDWPVIATDNKTVEQLTIRAVVKSDEPGYYSIRGYSSWSTDMLSPELKRAESTYRDSVGFTWGGNGAFLPILYSFGGKYYNNADLSVVTTTIDIENKGIIWSFYEASGIYAMRESEAHTNIRSSVNMQYRPAQIKFTYLHTYDQVIGSPYIEGTISSSGVSLAGGINFSVVQNYWSTDLAFNCLQY